MMDSPALAPGSFLLSPHIEALEHDDGSAEQDRRVNDELCREDGDPVVDPLCLCPEPGRFPIAVLLRLFDLVEGMRQRVFFFRKLQKLSSQNSAI